jgi:acyl carrier protein
MNVQVSEQQIREWCVDYVARVLHIPPADVAPDAELDRFGLDSAVTTAMIIDMEDWLGIEIPPALLFEQSTLSGIAAAVSQRLG